MSRRLKTTLPLSSASNRSLSPLENFPQAGSRSIPKEYVAEIVPKELKNTVLFDQTGEVEPVISGHRP
jgi:hypothetical protein